MNGFLFSIILLTPVVLLASGWFRHSKWSLTVAALPPLMASLLLSSGDIVDLDWLLLGSRLGTDAVTHWLLPAAALVWTAAALHHAGSSTKDSGAARFRLFFVLAMFGNLLLLLAQDAIIFYVGYAIMGLAGYGLVMQHRSTRARVASGIYLRWTIAGELMLFSGLLSLAHDVGTTQLPLSDAAGVSAWSLAMLIGGFGIKIGLPGLHAWMPGTYASSGTAGSVVFSGAMANAGILGLLHFLPLQQAGYTATGTLLLVFGLLGAFYGVLLGLPQRKPKVILAYSSISQLGTLAAMLGLALREPDLAPALIVAVTVYAVHHGLTKAALFLACDNRALARWRNPSIALLVILSLMMAGLPFSSGAVAKGLVKDAIGDGYIWLVAVLGLAGIATMLLMTRFVFACLAPSVRANSTPFWASVGMALLLLLVAHVAVYQANPLPALSMQGIWSLAIAMGLVALYALLPKRAHKALQPVIPKGDLPNLVAKALLRVSGRYPLIPTMKQLRARLSSSGSSVNPPDHASRKA